MPAAADTRAGPATSPERTERLRIAIRGAVQGVGFRPFVYRVATRLGVRGWVVNDSQGVVIEAEAGAAALRALLTALGRDLPPRAVVQSLEPTWLDAVGYDRFEIRPSESGGAVGALVLPDIAICDDCRAEILDPANRRHGYAFTNCTNCGPRFSIIEALPYDRAATTMRGFAMCPACEAEYRDPLDRRFHAQPNACPTCGPHVELWRPDGTVVATHDDALARAAAAIDCGAIVAVKGLGGFHLVVDAANAAAVARLRTRKHREEKPLALMVASMAEAETLCDPEPLERRLLASPEAPIVLVRRRLGAPIADNVAPSTATLGVMLAATPLHVLLLAAIGRPVVATSGNLSEEPICIDEVEAIGRLGAIADLLLVHDRPIARHVDDAIVRVIAGRETVLRRARGYAPLPVPVADADGILALGAHQKNAVALALGGNVFTSQHIGDLTTEPSHRAFREVIGSLQRLYAAAPAVVSCDLHPDYVSTHHAESLGLPVFRVQHHHAHVLSCMADNDLSGPVLGIAWDGTGYGLDGTIWGGEFLLVGRDVTPDGVASVDAAPCDRDSSLRSALRLGSAGRFASAGPLESTGRFEDAEPFKSAASSERAAPFERVAHLRTFRLLGGDAAAREPRRSALGVLYEVFGDRLFGDGLNGDGLTADGLNGDGLYGDVIIGDGLIGDSVNGDRLIGDGVFDNGLIDNGLNGDRIVGDDRMADGARIDSCHRGRGPSRGRVGDGRNADDPGRERATERAPLAAFTPAEQALAASALRRGINTPVTSSAGRLFDAIAALAGIRQRAGYEGQAAIELENAIGDIVTDEAYPIAIVAGGPALVLDWSPMVRAIIGDVCAGTSQGLIAARAHNGLVEAMVTVARSVGCHRIALSGGCFQNRYLAERATARLGAEGFAVYRHQRVPPNDGGIALGQVMAVVAAVPRKRPVLPGIGTARDLPASS